MHDNTLSYAHFQMYVFILWGPESVMSEDQGGGGGMIHIPVNTDLLSVSLVGDGDGLQLHLRSVPLSQGDFAQ